LEVIKEIGFDWTARDTRGYFTTNMKREVRRMTGFADTRPDEVTIIKDPKTNGGYLVALVPKAWFSVKPPRKRTLTDEQRVIISKRMLEIRKNKN
jgi:hypothetical protein